MTELTGKLEKSVIVFGLRYKGLSVSVSDGFAGSEGSYTALEEQLNGRRPLPGFQQALNDPAAAVAAAPLLPPLILLCRSKQCRSSAGVSQRTPQCTFAKTA